MTYNSYSNYQRMHSSLSNHSYLDGVPMVISEQFKPPSRIKLPRMTTRHVCDVMELEYDFSLERRVLAESESRRIAELAEFEASRVASAMNNLAETPENVPKDPGKSVVEKEQTPAWNLGPEILTPMPMSSTKEVAKGPEKAKILVKDFETVDDPFDDLELKVLDDMAELKFVLDVVQQSTSPIQQTNSPTQEETRTQSAPEKTDMEISATESSGQTLVLENAYPASAGPFAGQIVFNGTLPGSVTAQSPVKRKPVNLDDYNISLPNTDHLMAATQAQDIMQNSRTLPGSACIDLRQYITGRTMKTLPITNCVPPAAYNGFHSSSGTNLPSYSHLPVIGSKSDSDTNLKPVIIQNRTNTVIGQCNGTKTVIGSGGSVTSDQFGYSGVRMRSARSASDISKLKDEDDTWPSASLSPPPRIPTNRNRTTNGGRYSLAGTVALTSHQSVTALIDPFTTLNPDEQDFVAMFVDMGFPRPRAARAVELFGKDAKQVTDYLCLCEGLLEQGYPPDHVELAAQLAENQTKQAKDYLKVIHQLQEFGFPQSDIHKALCLHRADTDKCLDYLTAPT